MNKAELRRLRTLAKMRKAKGKWACLVATRRASLDQLHRAEHAYHAARFEYNQAQYACRFPQFA